LDHCNAIHVFFWIGEKFERMKAASIFKGQKSDSAARIDNQGLKTLESPGMNEPGT
jgi:hypothetical protein